MELIASFVESPVFQFLFGVAACMLILGIILHFGFKSAVALGYGVYDLMVVIFILALTVCIGGVGLNPESVLHKIFSQFYEEWLTPLVEVFGFHRNAGLDVFRLLYEAGKLLVLSLVIEALEKLFDFLRGIWKSIWMWWLSESTIAVVGVVLFTLLWNWLEKTFPGQLQWIVVIFFGLAALAMVVVGLLAVFGPLTAWLGSTLFEYLLTVMILTVLTLVLAGVVAGLDLMPKIDAFVQGMLHGSSAEALMMTGGVVLVLWLLWYVMYKLLRDHKIL